MGSNLQNEQSHPETTVRSNSFQRIANPTRLKTLLCKGFQPFRFGAGIATLCTDEVARNGAQLRNFGQRSQERPLHSLQSPPPALPYDSQLFFRISKFRSQI